MDDIDPDSDGDAFEDQHGDNRQHENDDEADIENDDDDSDDESPKRKLPTTGVTATRQSEDKHFYVYIAAKDITINFPNFFQSKHREIVKFFQRLFVSNNIDNTCINSIKPVNRTIRIDCGTLKAQNLLLDIKRIENIEVACTLPYSVTNTTDSRARTKLYRYVIHTITCDYTAQEVKQFCNCEEVKLFNSSKQTRSALISFVSEPTTNYVTIDYCRFKMHQYIPRPVRCFRCQAYDHTAASCRRDAPRCARCTEPHDTRDCTSATRLCVNCGQQHSAAWSGCPTYVKKRAERAQPTNEAAGRLLAQVAAPTSSSSTTAVRSSSSAPVPGATRDSQQRTLPTPTWTIPAPTVANWQLSKEAWTEQIDTTKNALNYIREQFKHSLAEVHKQVKELQDEIRKTNTNLEMFKNENMKNIDQMCNCWNEDCKGISCDIIKAKQDCNNLMQEAIERIEKKLEEIIKKEIPNSIQNCSKSLINYIESKTVKHK